MLHCIVNPASIIDCVIHPSVYLCKIGRHKANLRTDTSAGSVCEGGVGRLDTLSRPFARRPCQDGFLSSLGPQGSVGGSDEAQRVVEGAVCQHGGSFRDWQSADMFYIIRMDIQWSFMCRSILGDIGSGSGLSSSQPTASWTRRES